MNHEEIRALAYAYALKCVGSGPYLNLMARAYMDAYKQGWIDRETQKDTQA